MSPTVSVIIPAHNKGSTIASTIESVQRQTIKEVEIIVVDDGSTDETSQQVAALDGAVRYIRQETLGVSIARNRGIAEARGEFVAFLDGDDLWLPHKLEVQLDCLRREPSIDAVHCSVHLVDNQLRVIDSRHCNPAQDTWLDFLCFRNLPGLGSTLLARTPRIRALGGFGADLVILEDWDLACRFAQYGGLRSLPEFLVLYRQHPGNRSQNVDIHVEPGFRSLGRLFADPTLPAEIRACEKEIWARLYAMLARGYGRNGQWLQAARWALRALGSSPRVASYLAVPSSKRRGGRLEAAVRRSFADELPFGVIASS